MVTAAERTNIESFPLFAVESVDVLAIVTIHNPNRAVICHTNTRIHALVDPIFPIETLIARCEIKSDETTVVIPKPDRSVQCVTHIIHPKTLIRRRYPFFLELYGIDQPISPLYLYDRHTPSFGLYIILQRQQAIPHLQTRAFRWAATGYFHNEIRFRCRRRDRGPDANAPGSFR